MQIYRENLREPKQLCWSRSDLIVGKVDEAEKGVVEQRENDDVAFVA